MKEFGKLSTDQFRRLFGHMPELKQGLKELPELLRNTDSEKIREVLDNGVYWSGLYELSFIESVAFSLHVLGQKDRLIEISKKEDPQAAMLAWMEDQDAWEPRGEDGKELTLAQVLPVAICLQRQVLSIMLYRRSLSALISEARDGQDASLFDAVRIDRSVLACPSVAMRISKAEARKEKDFFQHLRRAVKGPSQKHWEALNDLRFALVVLRECGLDSISDADLEYLLVDVLKVYPKTPAARKNLRKQYYESKRFRTT